MIAIIALVSFGLAIYGFLKLIANKHYAKQNFDAEEAQHYFLTNQDTKEGFLYFIQLFFVCGIIVLYNFVAKTNGRDDLREIVKQPNVIVSINNQAVSEEEQKNVLKALHTIENKPPHHSHIVKYITVQLNYNRQSKLIYLGKDSSIPTEYWVLENKEEQEIGRINTDVFDDY